MSRSKWSLNIPCEYSESQSHCKNPKVIYSQTCGLNQHKALFRISGGRLTTQYSLQYCFTVTTNRCSVQHRTEIKIHRQIFAIFLMTDILICNSRIIIIIMLSLLEAIYLYRQQSSFMNVLLSVCYSSETKCSFVTQQTSIRTDFILQGICAEEQIRQ
jgi:hypothetical protein